MQPITQGQRQGRPPEIGWADGAPLVIRLSEVKPDQRSLVGGKAANLAAMLQAGLPVPAGFCVTTAAFESFMAGCPDRERIPALMAGLSAGDRERVRSVSRQAQDWLRQAPIPPSVRDLVKQAWRAFGVDGRYAVRSSATIEDGNTRSFAGQFETVLDVCGQDALLAAIKTCWLSLFSQRALAYRAKRGVPLKTGGMAVLVQEMVAAEWSGVAFTADPLTGTIDQVLVECVAGLGDLLVQGRACPKRFLVAKEIRRVFELPDSRPDEKRPKLQLPEATLQKLLDFAQRAERLFGGPQDIEWAQHAGELFLLQSRPITTHTVDATHAQVVWSNFNAVENFQEVVTPMAWSFLDSCVRHVGDPLFRGLGVDPDREPWLGLVAGRVYMNVLVAQRFLLRIPGLGTEQLSQLFGGHHDAITRAVGPGSREHRGDLSFWARVRGKVGIMGFLFRRVTWRSRKSCLARLKQVLAQFLGVNYQKLTDEELSTHLNALLQYGYREFQLPAVLGFGLGATVVFRHGCAKWLGDSEGALANRLISRAGGMASAEAALDLWRLAAWTAGQDPLRKLVSEEQCFATLAGTLAASGEGRAFLDRWQALLARHGHRARGEVDLGVPRWSETPDEVLRLLRHYLDSVGQLNLLESLEQRTRERDQRLADCRARLRNPFRRRLFGWLLRQAQGGLAYRENFKNELLRVVAHLRRVLIELGERLALAGRLETTEDIFFLTLEEIEPVRSGAAAFDVRGVIRARREEYRKNQALKPPPVIVGEFDPARPAPPLADPNATVLRGLPVSSGIVTGRARVVLSADTPEKVLPGEILVAPYTDPGWTPLFLTAAGLVVDLGGQLSHGSVLAREYGLPAVVNVQFATQVIQTGQLLCVDGNHGVVTVLADPAGAVGT